MTESPLRSRLRALLLDARRGGDRTRAALLRGLLAELENAEAVPSTPSSTTAVGVGAAEAERRVVTEAEERALVAQGLADVESALPHLERADPERAAAERAALDTVRSALQDLR